MSGEVTIPRDLFDQLCEAAIFREAEIVGYAQIPHERWRKRYEEAKSVAVRAVAFATILTRPTKFDELDTNCYVA